MKFSAEEVLAEINSQAGAFGVNPTHASAIFMAENSGSGRATSGNGAAISPMGAQGVMQVMPATARGLQKAGLLPADWKYDPSNLKSQVAAGLAAMKDVGSRMKNPDDPFELAAGYNGSPAVHKAYLSGGKMPEETVGYIAKIKTALANFGTPSTPTAGAKTMPANNPSAYVAPASDASAAAPSGASANPASAVGSSSSSSIRRNVNDPAMMANFTDAIMSVAGPGGSIDEATNAIIAGGTTRQNNVALLQQAITRQAQAAGEEAAAKTAVEAAAAARHANIITGLNLNPDITNNEMLRAGAVVDETAATLAAMKPEIDERMAVGMFDNPFQWLVNQTILPGLVAKYNGVVGVQNAATDTFKTKANIASTQLQLSTAMDADLIKSQGLATKARIAEAANIELQKVQLEQDGATTREALSIAQLDGTKAQLLGGLMEKTKEVETVREGESQKQATARAEQEKLDQINKVITAAGGTPLATLKGMPAAKMEELYSAVSGGKFGKNFSESFDFIANRGNLDNVAVKGGAAVRQWYQGTMAAVGKVVAAKAKDPRNIGKKFDAEEETKAALDSYQNLYQEEAAVDMTKASDTNPMKLQYTTIAKHPDLANNPLATFINAYGPTSKDPRFVKVDEAYIMQRFAHSVSSGKMKMPDAVAAITEFYKVGTMQQAVATSWPLFGLTKPTKTYAVKLPNMGTPATVDLGNPSQVENLITTKMALDFREKNVDIMLGRGSSLQKRELDSELAADKKKLNQSVVNP